MKESERLNFTLNVYGNTRVCVVGSLAVSSCCGMDPRDRQSWQKGPKKEQKHGCRKTGARTLREQASGIGVGRLKNQCWDLEEGMAQSSGSQCSVCWCHGTHQCCSRCLRLAGFAHHKPPFLEKGGCDAQNAVAAKTCPLQDKKIMEYWSRGMAIGDQDQGQQYEKRKTRGEPSEEGLYMAWNNRSKETCINFKQPVKYLHKGFQ